MISMERERKEFSDRLNKDLLWMSQNFMDFLEYMKGYVEEDVNLLEEVRKNILSAVKTAEALGKNAQGAKDALRILASMIEALEKGIKGDESVQSARNRVRSLYEEFKRIPRAGS